MKKILLAALLLTIGLVSCSSCATKQPPAPSPAPTASVPDAAPKPITVVVTGDDWEFTLPDGGWEVQQACKPDGACVTLAVNESRTNLVIFLRKANNDSLEANTLKQVRAAKDQGAVVNSTKQLTLNGHNFVLLEATKDNAKVFVWFTQSNGIGYEFSCGGPNDDGHQVDLCAGVASTLKIK